MANVMVPSLNPGERSLPAELRVGRGAGFAQRRMAASLQPSANPTYWNQRRLMGMGYLRGLGQDDTSLDLGGDTSGIYTGTLTPIDVTSTLPEPVVIPPISGATASQINSAVASIDANTNMPGLVATNIPGYSGPSVAQPNASVPAPPSGYQWANLINQSGQNIAKILTLSQGGSSVTLPNGTQLLYGSNSGAAASSALASIAGATGLSSNTLILVGLGVAAFLLMKK